MGRIVRLRKANTNTNEWETLYPESVTNAILRDTGKTQEDSNILYDEHIVNTNEHIYRAKSFGTPSTLEISIPGVELIDQLTVVIEVHTEISAEPTLSLNGGENYNIVCSDGANTTGGQIAGSNIIVTWCESIKKWMLNSGDLENSSTRLVVPVVSYYKYETKIDGETNIPIPTFNRKEDKLTVNIDQTILIPGEDYTILQDNSILFTEGRILAAGKIVFFTIEKFVECVRRGFKRFTLDTSYIKVDINQDNTTTLPVPELGDTDFEVLLNVNQTILREGIDFERDYVNKSLTLINGITLSKRDVVVFIISRYIETISTITDTVCTGNYQCITKPIYESYTASKDNEKLIMVPSFDPYRDDLQVVLNNLVLVGDDVDYSVDKTGDILLLHDSLSAGQTIYFRIIKGLRVEQTQIKVVTGMGTGKDILVNISDTLLHDRYCLVVIMPETIEKTPTLKLLDGPIRKIVNADGRDIIAGSTVKGAPLFITYNEENNIWYNMANSSYMIFNPDEEHMGLIKDIINEHDRSPNAHENIVIDCNDNTIDILTGTSNFSGLIVLPIDYKNSQTEQKTFAETIIPHNLGYIPLNYTVTPSEPPSRVDENGKLVEATIGDIWIDIDEKNMYVGNSGTATSKFKWIIYK